MAKRGLILRDYDTAAKGWTLCECLLENAEQQTIFIDVPGGVTLDASTALTDGEPSYYTRQLTARLERSDGKRPEREAHIREMVNTLDGYRLDITLPDNPDHHLTGRVRISKDYSDLAHASVSISATCDPWLYSNAERIYNLTATSTEKEAQLTNAGRLAVVPTIEVTGTVQLTDGAFTQQLNAGTWQLPWIYLRPGITKLKYSGSGTIRIRYREAVLL